MKKKKDITITEEINIEKINEIQFQFIKAVIDCKFNFKNGQIVKIFTKYNFAEIDKITNIDIKKSIENELTKFVILEYKRGNCKLKT